MAAPGRWLTPRLVVVGRVVVGRTVVGRVVAGRTVVGRVVAGRVMVGRVRATGASAPGLRIDAAVLIRRLPLLRPAGKGARE